MTKMVERAAAAVRAYRGWPAGTDVVARLKEGHMLSDDANALQDLLTDLEHLAEASGVRVNEYAAHRNYLAEAHRCLECGMTQLEIEKEAADDPEFGDPEVCSGHWEKHGDAGPHEFDDIQAGEDEDAVQEFRRKLDGND